ncbi:chromate transporter [Mycoplasmopsis primatum]|uniref:chromate transporter n=1 Tax=Mycoplasmopsis primatum TaxID=55604 RepID=UPI0004976DA0|nr:chromate transporter [Mycoplasmopsis primatum]
MNKEKKLKSQDKKKPTFFNVLWFIIFSSFIGFGGGNALLPIFKRYSVDKYHWLTEKEFEENVILTNMLPGASVIQALSYISFKTLNFWKATIVVFFGILPHVIFAFTLFYFAQYLPLQYLFTIEVAVISTIIGSLVVFIFNYVKKGTRVLRAQIWSCLFLLTLIFTLFVPAPYNMPIIIMAFIIISFAIIFFVKRKINKNQVNKNSDLLNNKEEK